METSDFDQRAQRLAAALRQAVQGSGLTEKQVASRCTWFSSPAYLSRALHGKQTLSLQALQAVASVLGQDYRQLLAESGFAEETYRSRRTPGPRTAGRSDRSLGAARDASGPATAPLGTVSTCRESGLPLSHEERAEHLSVQEQNQWDRAATHWRLAADEAKRAADWARWGRCRIGAAMMALLLGQMERSERQFKQILSHPPHELPALTRAEAMIRLGWLFCDREEFGRARRQLEAGLALARTAVGPMGQEFRIMDNDMAVRCDGPEAARILEHIARHFLGRIDIASGAAARGLSELAPSCNFARSKKDAWSLGCRLIDSIPAIAATDGSSRLAVEAALGECKDLIGGGPCGDGLLFLAEAQWRTAAGTGDPMPALEAARAASSTPFFARGLSDVYREMSCCYRSRGAMQQEVLAYALAAVLVRPFGRNLSTLAQSAAEAATAENGGSRRFGVLWRELEEQVLLMEREPFRDLNFLVEQCGYEESRAHLEKGLRAARQIVQGFLLR